MANSQLQNWQHCNRIIVFLLFPYNTSNIILFFFFHFFFFVFSFWVFLKITMRALKNFKKQEQQHKNKFACIILSKGIFSFLFSFHLRGWEDKFWCFSILFIWQHRFGTRPKKFLLFFLHFKLGLCVWLLLIVESHSFLFAYICADVSTSSCSSRVHRERIFSICCLSIFFPHLCFFFSPHVFIYFFFECFCGKFLRHFEI